MFNPDNRLVDMYTIRPYKMNIFNISRAICWVSYDISSKVPSNSI